MSVEGENREQQSPAGPAASGILHGQGHWQERGEQGWGPHHSRASRSPGQGPLNLGQCVCERPLEALSPSTLGTAGQQLLEATGRLSVPAHLA